MNPIRTIRRRLGLSQRQLAEALGRTQGNVAFYERGQTVPPAVAARLIEFARAQGLGVSYEHIYAGADLPVGGEGAEMEVRDAA